MWPQAVLRGDYGTIVVGAATNVQDGAVLHATDSLHTYIGSGVVIGHLAHLEGCTVKDGALIGVGATVLHEAIVEEDATVGAGAVVTNGMIIPAGALAVGVPATVKPLRSDSTAIAESAKLYVANSIRYSLELRRID